MGCDGGSIPRRDEMVKLKKKAEKVRIWRERERESFHDVGLSLLG